jgi:hypothetical protein
MSVVPEIVTQWIPFGIGVADAALTAYYVNNFVATDVDNTRGILSGKSGDAILGLSTASVAVQGWAVLEWVKYVLKRQEGKLSIQNRNERYAKTMLTFWWLMMLFYLLAIVLGALNIQMVTQYDSVPVTINGTKLQGSYGNAVAGMSYATLAVGGLSFLTYLWAEFGTRSMNEPHPRVTEAHGGF